MRALLVALLVGCADRLFCPPVSLIGAPAPTPHGWEPLGFSFGDPGLGECGRGWYEFDQTDCQITIGVVRAPSANRAQADRFHRIVTIDPSVIDLEIPIAHEVGHILLDTAEHTQGGIMGGATAEMGAVDFELACRSIGRGC